MVPNHPLRKTVAEPASGTTDQLDIRRVESNLLFKLPVHRLLGGLIVINPPLRKLPGILTHTPSPEHLAAVIGDNNSYIGTKAFRIDHAGTLVLLIRLLFHKSAQSPITV